VILTLPPKMKKPVALSAKLWRMHVVYKAKSWRLVCHELSPSGPNRKTLEVYRQWQDDQSHRHRDRHDRRLSRLSERPARIACRLTGGAYCGA
jgi:hypothetical protein